MAVSCRGVFQRPVFFTALLSITMFTYFGVQGAFSTGILTTLQREFKLKSSQIGFMLTVNDIVGLLVVTPLAYFGAKRHRPRILGILSLVFALGCFTCTIPQFIGNGDDDAPAGNDTGPMIVQGKSKEVALCIHSEDDVDMDDECSASEQAASGAQYERAFWLYIGQALCGIGGVAYFPLGITYIDDGVSKTSSSVHVAALFMMGSLAPVFAFSISALCLSYHTDFYKIDVSELGYDDQDPRWIGAWWLGYLIYTCLFIVISIPFFFFPKEWPTTVNKKEEEELREMNSLSGVGRESSPTAASMIKNMMPQEGTSLVGIIKGYLFSMTRLLTNLSYVACLMAVVAELSAMAGFFSFVGRYIQTQFGITPSLTSVILGCVLSPTAFFGNLFGGLLVKKLKPTMRGLAGLALGICTVVLLLTPLYFIVGCSTVPIAGVTVPYPGTDELDMRPTCKGECECPSGVYTPVCGSDGITYITPCHAGCSEYTEGSKFDGSEPKTSRIYSGCSCIGSNYTYQEDTDTFEEYIATQEACQNDCSAKLIGFIVLFGVGGLINSMIKNPSFMLKLRCVESEDRAISLGLGSLLMRVLGFIPAPIYFGAAIQQTCLMFQESCGRTGNCLIYDNDRLRNMVFGLLLLLKFASFFAYSVAFLSIRKDKSGVYHQTQLCSSKKEKPTSV